MKVLAIDDQRLVLLPIKKRLEELGYEVHIETNPKYGVDRYYQVNPDLIIVDINMPEINGMELIASFRSLDKEIPIMVLSGNSNDQVIIDSYDLGINDYVKKPLSLVEVCARVKNLIGPATANSETISGENVLIQHRCVGVVIPCYNEEKRLLSDDFLKFVDENGGYHLCFVNDGSKDNTLESLNKLKKGREDYISVIDCEKNGGKAEAVRIGMLELAKMEELDYIGFLDADLSTDFSDFEILVKSIEKSDHQVVIGSRIHRMGANITKDSARKIISKTINLIIRKILGMDFQDTQCGAKIFRKEVIEIVFSRPFITRWIFDVEMFMRMKNFYGLNKAKNMICEVPLMRWIHADGSKLSYKDSLKIGIQLFKIAYHYNRVSSPLNVGKYDMIYKVN